MENLPTSSGIEPKMESGKKLSWILRIIDIHIQFTAPETSKQSVQPIHKPDAPRDNTMGMILLRRRFNYVSRPRPNALAIVDPATNQVLYPGIAKIEKIPEKEIAVGDGDAKVNNVFQSYEQQQLPQQTYFDFPAEIHRKFRAIQGLAPISTSTILSEPMQHIIVPEPQYVTTFMIPAGFDPNNNPQTSFQQPIKYHDLPYMNDGRHQ